MLELPLLIIRLLLIKKKIAVANSYYVTNLKQFMEFYEDFYFDGEEWDKDIWDRRKLPLPDDKVNPTQYEYVINFKGFAIRILNNS